MLTKQWHMYIDNNDLFNKYFKLTFIPWTSLAISVGTYPFILAFIDFVAGKYTEESWQLIYQSF